MSWTNKNIYFETSAVNKLAAELSIEDAIATKAYQHVRGNRWYLSPATIWEILITTDKKERENIIQISQHLFHEKLLRSPSELIIQFIINGCPIEEDKYDFHSKSDIQEGWKDLCKNSQLTFIYDLEQLRKRSVYLQDISKKLFRIINTIVFDLKIESFESSFQLFLNQTIDRIFQARIVSDKRLFKLSLVFILYVICIGTDLDPAPINSFWKTVGISDTRKRFEYIIKEYEVLIYRGPIAEMALMAYNQIYEKNLSSRGLFKDCYHTLYLPYVDLFITNDDHFKKLKNFIDHPNYKKIYHFDQLEKKKHMRKL